MVVVRNGCAVSYNGGPASRWPRPMSQPITELLQAWRVGDPDAQSALGEQVYATLKRMASQRVRGGAGGATLDATALVHEAVARMLDSDADWNSRAHFYALAALQMRAVLVDAARRRQASKRGGDWAAVSLDADQLASTDDSLLELHDALERLAGEDPRTARVVELTYFGGLTSAQVAEVCGTSVATVERDLKFGRAWLRDALTP
jgi:RNA polymerase sigma factor (TIGR02999 family)